MKAADRARLTTALRDHVGKIAADLRLKMCAPGDTRVRAQQLHADEQVAEDFDVWTDLLSRRAAPLENTPEGVVWHTFAGGAVDRLLSAGLEQASGEKWVAGNLSLRCKDIALSAAREAMGSLSGIDWERTAASAARGMSRGIVSKFQPCLPVDAEDRLLAERLLDLAGTLTFLGSVKVGGVRLSLRPEGARLREGEVASSTTLDFRFATVPGPAATPKNNVEWVDTAGALRTVGELLTRQTLLGLDVETALDFGTLCLVQVATHDRTFLIDPFAVGDLSPLAPALSAAIPTKIIHHAAFERRALAAAGIEIQGVVDTLDDSRRVRGPDVPGGHSLAAVCERELGLKLDKAPQTSDWARRPLAPEQLRYAALDAEVLLALGERFLEIDGIARRE